MAELATLARPYAKAAFDHAQELGQVDGWASGLSLMATLVQQPELAAYINRPNLLPAQQVDALVQAAGGSATADFRNFVTLLAQNARLELFPQISAEFNRLKARQTRQIDVTIESAFALTDSQQLLLASRLEKRFGAQINTTVVVRPELISGVVIRAGDQVIDDSALGKLAKMKLSLLA